MADVTEAVNPALTALINALDPDQSTRYVGLKRKRSYYKGRLTFYKNNFEQIQTHTVASLNTLTSALNNVDTKFAEIQQDLENEFGEIEHIAQERLKFDNEMFNLRLRISEALQNITPTTSAQSNTVIHTQSPTQSNAPKMQLPPISLPKFDGDRKNYLSWQQQFEAMIGNRPDLDDTTKKMYLDSAVADGTASHIVNASSGTDFETAMTHLQEEYGNDVQLKYQLVSELYSIKGPDPKKPKSLTDFILRVESCVHYLTRVEVPVDKWDLLLIHHLSLKLDAETRKELEREKSNAELMTFDTFMKFLRSRVSYLNLVKEVDFKPQFTSTPINKPANQVVPYQRSRTYYSSPGGEREEVKYMCPFCSKDHSVFECTEFRALDHESKVSKIRELNLCFNCLKPNHTAAMCTAGVCQKCQKKHHTLLHRQRAPVHQNALSQTLQENLPPPTDENTNADENTQQTFTVVKTRGSGIVLLATAIVLIEDEYGNRTPCRAFLDSGSTTCFMTNQLAQTLRLKKIEVNTTVCGINSKESVNKHSVQSKIYSRLNSYSVHLEFLVTKKITGPLPVSKVDTETWNLPPSSELADPNFNTPDKIDILLGAEVFYDVVLDGKRQLHNSLWLYSSKLGYFIAGKLIPITKKECTFVSIHELKDLITRFWQIETVENQTCYTLEEKACEKHYERYTVQRPDKHYEVALPVNNLIQQLGRTDRSAARIYFNSERKIDTQPEKKEEYDKFIREMITLGHLELAPIEPTGKVNYMTHHMISRPTSTTTKYRVVFNASHKSDTGISLNDSLMVGPTIQPEIFVHLIRWRQLPIATVSDAEKMYRQVYVREQDRDLQRIFWRFDKSESVKSYRLTTVTYGTACAPFLAIRTLKRLADDNVIDFPDVAPVLSNHIYVDDYSSSHRDIETALRVKSRLNQLASEGGFNFRKWSSNAPELNDDSITDEVTLVLGIVWNRSNDTIDIDFSNIKLNPVVTKSSVLGEIASLYDPLGLCAPVVMKAKLFMQRIWSETELNWNDELSDNILNDWNVYRQQLTDMKKISVHRALVADPDEEIVLHGFCDGSLKGYGACIYLVSGNSSRLVAAKSRVAPIKPTTAPRMELCAAVLLAKLMYRVKNSLQTKVSRVYYWSDSEITVFRIKSSPSIFNVYVGTRIGDIHELSNPIDWRHVGTFENPADCVSRGLLLSELMVLDLWWYGPRFILRPEAEWPQQQKFDLVNNRIDLELKKNVISSVSTEVVKKMSNYAQHFTSWRNATKAIAYYLRFWLNTKKPLPYRNTAPIDAQEWNEAELRLIRMIQSDYFGEELKLLEKKNGTVTQSSKLFKLTPFLDADHIIRVGGRLNRGDFNYDQKHPIVIPQCELASLLTRQVHEDNFHCGPQSLISYVRQRYWVMNLHGMARTTVHNCVICFKNKPVLLNQLMGDLVQQRLHPTRAFQNTGIDFAGPFYVKPQPRSKVVNKVYVALFTCFATRCTHLEVVSNLTSKSFIAALQRFIARRGIPTFISTDNGTNFIGARNELIELREAFLSDETLNEFKEYCASLNIQWLTIPQRSPHWGGLWESMVKLMKYHLKRATSEVVFAPEIFLTLITRIEGILNSRPLTQLSYDPNDLRPLTPGHFLIGGPINELPDFDYTNVPDNRLNMYQQLQKLQSCIWKRFQLEYFHELQQRAKWCKKIPNVEVGRLAMIRDENLPPSRWKLGRILETYTGRDGLVRAVLLKTQGGQTRRSIGQIAILPVDD